MLSNWNSHTLLVGMSNDATTLVKSNACSLEERTIKQETLRKEYNDRKRLLLRKVMTNLDSILKSRDITLLTKVHRVKAMVFPVVMYGCEN